MVTLMLLYCAIAESSWEEAIICAVDRIPPGKADRAGLRQSSCEELRGKIQSLDKLSQIDCRGNPIIPVHGKAHESRSEKVMSI